MYKKFIQTSLVILILILGVQASFATTSSGSGYNAPILRSAFDFKATLQDGKVSMSWVPYAPAGFDYYKVIRSTTDANPVYPDDGYIYFTSETNASSYVDSDPPAGKVYYRVCSIASPNRYCSSVATLVVGSDVGLVSPMDVLSPASVVLKGSALEGVVVLDWTVEGVAPYGFKICKSSVNREPMYPIKPGDAYQYLTDPAVRQLKDSTVRAGVTYYYRVCQYDGKGACVSYSNPVSVVMATDGLAATEDKTASQVSLSPAVIKLNEPMWTSGYLGTGLNLTWHIDGDGSAGYKVVRSTKNENPTYPALEGDYAVFVSDSSAKGHVGSSDSGLRGFNDKDAKYTQAYYYRVCQYDGKGACLSYSNSAYYKPYENEITADPVFPPENDKSLEDIIGHSYETAIGYLLNKNIVQGYSDNTFRPNASVNRAEFVKMILNSKYGPDAIGTGANCFRDVKVAWYSPYICLAKEKGVVSGYKDGTFKPSRTISFAEASKIVSELYGIETQVGSNWYEGYVKALQAKKYIPQTVTAPDKNLTRGEVAELLWRVEEQKSDQPSAEVLVSGGGESVSMATGEYAGWQAFEKNGYSFYYPASWYRGLKSYGWDMISEEKDYIDNLNVQNYMAVDTYVATYLAVRNGALSSSLATKVAFGHPLVSSKSLTVNGFPALRRAYRAPSGTVVNGRTTGENEIIIAYTYLKDGKVIMVQYFNASGSESYGVDQFDKIALSFR